MATSHPIDRAFLFDRDDNGALILVRHGQQDSSPPRVDAPLTELGHKQAGATADHLAAEPVAAVYSSDLARARSTGQAIADRHDLPLNEIGDLREIMLDYQMGDDERDAARERWVIEQRWDAYPGGEGSARFRKRTVGAIEAILADHDGQTVVVACHGGVINAYLAELLDVVPDMFFRPAHASVHRLAFGADRRVIRSLNEVHHLDGLLTW